LKSMQWYHLLPFPLSHHPSSFDLSLQPSILTGGLVSL
jgi:hypothetical protein